MGWIHNASPELESQSNYAAIVGSAIATTVVMVAVVSSRAYVRIRIVKNLGADDWLILVSTLFALAYTAGGIEQTRWGLGLPRAGYPPQNIVTSRKLNYAFRPFYCISAGCWKISLCISYLHITHNSQAHTYRKILWAVMAFSIIFTIYYTLTTTFACTPIRHYAYPHTPGSCLPVPMVYYVPAVVSMLVDITLFLLPIPLVLNLHLSRKRKWGLVIAFLLGLVTSICSILRLIGTIEMAHSADPAKLIVWAIAEQNVGLIMASLPTLAPLLKVVPNPLRLRPNTNNKDSSHSTTPSTSAPTRRRRSIDETLLRPSDEEIALPPRRPSPFAPRSGWDDGEDGMPRLKPVVITKSTEIEMVSSPRDQGPGSPRVQCGVAGGKGGKVLGLQEDR